MKRSSIAILTILNACTVGPNYQPPENCVHNDWNISEDAEMVLTADPMVQWWEVFQDPFLSRYIDLAVKNNQEILTAISNVLQAKALRKIAASSFYPQIGADVSALKTHFSKTGPLLTLDSTSQSPFAVQIPLIQTLFNALFDASWEIDLFGKTRRTVEAADATIQSVIEQKNDLLISVMAEIARNYMELRGLQKRQRLVQENIDILNKKAFIIRKQFEIGYADRLDDENIQYALVSEQAKLPDLSAQIHQNTYILSILTGSMPETLLDELLCLRVLPEVPPSVAVGLKSDLLRRRPDVRQAERNLAIATANVGVAIASFFPTFILTGNGGFQSLALSKLFSWDSRTWSVGADTGIPLFKGGRLQGNLEAQYAESEAVFHTYQQTVLKALEETESALIAFTKSKEVTQRRQEALKHQQTLLTLNKAKTLSGITSLLDLLDAEQNVIQAEQLALDSKMSSLLHLITLYKALGGGSEIENIENN